MTPPLYPFHYPEIAHRVISKGGTYVEIVKQGSGYYVFWETRSEYGSKGRGLTLGAAIALAKYTRRPGAIL